MSIKGAVKHFNTITKHRHAVIKHCARAGILWQGLFHDLSKYSPTEFIPGARYYVGTRSPNELEREVLGYSLAWMHHKGRNKHHFEYWSDYNPVSRKYLPIKMPLRYVAEMVCDRVAASKIYQGEKYTDASALVYLQNGVDRIRMHSQTQQELEYILTMLRDEGEEKTFRYIKNVVLQGQPFPWEQEG